MLKTMGSGVTWSYPLDKKSDIKCEGHRGFWSILDAATYENEVYVLLEHNTYGDDTPFILAVLPRAVLRWYIVENPRKDKITKYFYIRAEDVLEQEYESIEELIIEHYNGKPKFAEIEIWTDEEINNMEVV